MYALMFLIRGRKDMTPEEAQRFWLETHGYLVASNLKAGGGRIYQQFHTLLDHPITKMVRENRKSKEEPFIGLVIAQYRSMDEVEMAFSEAFDKVLVHDPNGGEALFVDLEHSLMFTSREHFMFDERADAPWMTEKR